MPSTSQYVSICSVLADTELQFAVIVGCEHLKYPLTCIVAFLLPGSRMISGH